MTIQPPSTKELLRQYPQITKLDLLKKGGFKAVYRAILADHHEAFKLVQLPDCGQDETGEAFRKEAVGRIRREIDALGKCNVPELVKLGSLESTLCSLGGLEYVAYSEEFLDGSDLWELIKMTHPAPPGEDELRSLFRSLLLAIKELWIHGYIHRDIKPLNVIKMLDEKRPFVLLDLGIAYSVRETALTYNCSQRLPPATFRYMAPEMAYPDFREHLDYRSDLYSAALTVYEYAAKVHPLARDSDDLIQTITRTVRVPAKPLKQFRQDLSDDFCRLLDQMLKKKPALRPSNLDRLIAEMEKEP